jgi:recombination protein RecR
MEFFNRKERKYPVTGIGKRTVRLVLHLLKQPKEQTGFFGSTLVNMREDIKYCTNVTTFQIVLFVRSALIKINHQIVCVVEDIRDVMAIENTGQFRGVYFRWQNIPIDGVGPSQLRITTLVEKVKAGVNEGFCFKLNNEGDNTSTPYR